MKIKYFIKNKIIIFLFLTFLAFLLSCERQIGTDPEPVPTERPVSGTLVDANDNSIRIQNAIVSITPISDKIDYPTMITTSNNEGYFEVTTLVLPISQLYQLQIDATNSGYHIKDTIVSCNCEFLELNLILLEKYDCGISVSPSIENFGFSPIPQGQIVNRDFTITNTSISELDINSISVSDQNDFQILNNPIFPFSMLPGDNFQITVSFTPSEIKEYNESLIVSTTCDSSDYFANLAPVSKYDSCGIDLSNINVSVSPNPTLIGANTTGTVIFKNKYDRPITINQIIFPNSNYTLDPNIILPETLENLDDEFTFSFTFSSLSEGVFNDTIKINTDCEIQNQFEVPIEINMSNRECSFSDVTGFIVTDNISRGFSLGHTIYSINVNNESNIFDLEVAILDLPDSPFSVEPSNTLTLPPGGFATFTITFDLAQTIKDAKYNDQLILSTNGSCDDLVVNLVADANIPGVEDGKLYRWSEKIVNPIVYHNVDQLYLGFDFSAQGGSGIEVGDSTLLCNITGFPQPDFPGNQTADFRYMGMEGDNIEFPTNLGQIKTKYEWYYLGPVDQLLGFDFVYYNSTFNPATISESNCSNFSLNEGDVIVIFDGNDHYFVNIVDIRREKTLGQFLKPEFINFLFYKRDTGNNSAIVIY